MKSLKTDTKQPATLDEVLIIIPTLGDRPILLKKLLESIGKQQQAYKIVIVGGLNSSIVIDLAKKYKAIHIKDPGGITSAVNAGFKMASPNHEFATWLGDDDLLRENSLKNTLKMMKSNNNAVVVYGRCDYINDDGDLIFTNKSGRLAPWIMKWGPNFVPLPGMLYRISAVKEVGYFDESLKYAMDLDMLLKLKKIGKFKYIPETIGAFRWHSASTTVAGREKSLQEAQMIKRKYLPDVLRSVAPVWEWPVKKMTIYASKSVSKKANQ